MMQGTMSLKFTHYISWSRHIFEYFLSEFAYLISFNFNTLLLYR